METIKSYTDIEQSKKLAKILPIESADMYWIKIDDDESFDGSWETVPKNSSLIAKDDEPLFCWSLAALLDILPTGKVLLHDKGNRGYKCICNNIDSYYFNNPVDACYEMIIKLKEMNLI